MTDACWKCRGDAPPNNSAQILALCPEHLAERVKYVMLNGPAPSQQLPLFQGEQP